MIGKTVAHYEIIAKLGEGGMGVVWKARDTRLDRYVALKLLPPGRATSPERKRRFVQEAKSASALNHPNIVHIYDIGEVDGALYIAMECVEGQSLDSHIAAKSYTLGDALKFAAQIADAMACAHAAGVVHRDLKPSNIVVTDERLVKVIDFGLAKLDEMSGFDEVEVVDIPTANTRIVSGRSTAQGVVVGTPAYMSPEQAGGHRVDGRSDVFSFGVILYELVSGTNPFRRGTYAATLSAVVTEDPTPRDGRLPGVVPELESLVFSCLSKDPERRLASMAEISVGLKRIEEQSGTGHPVLRDARETRRFWYAAALSLAAVGVLAASAWWWSGPSPPAGPTAPTANPVAAGSHTSVTSGVKLIQANLRAGCAPSQRGTYFGDVDGDGKADAIAVNHDQVTDAGTIFVRLAGTSGFGDPHPWLTVPFRGLSASEAAARGLAWTPTMAFVDVNGDRRADAVAITTTGVRVAVSEGAGFHAPVKWTIGPYYGTEGTFIADIDGDGRADITVVNRIGTTRIVSVTLAIGPVSGSAGVFQILPRTWKFSRDISEFVDVTGDGRADAVTWAGVESIKVRRNLPSASPTFLRFSAEEEWTEGAYTGTLVEYLADVTGDKRADAIVISDVIAIKLVGGVTVRPSAMVPRGRFLPNQGWAYEDFHGGIATYFADVTGDGRADAIALDTDGIRVRRSRESVFDGEEQWSSVPYYGDLFPSCGPTAPPPR